jgi:hypothetical protein
MLTKTRAGLPLATLSLATPVRRRFDRALGEIFPRRRLAISYPSGPTPPAKMRVFSPELILAAQVIALQIAILSTPLVAPTFDECSAESQSIANKT